jgi:hypothetical protein
VRAEENTFREVWRLKPPLSPDLASGAGRIDCRNRSLFNLNLASTYWRSTRVDPTVNTSPSERSIRTVVRSAIASHDVWF